MIIVTGSNGFIGSHLVQLLCQVGEEVLAVDHGCQDRYAVATNCLRLEPQALLTWLEYTDQRVTGLFHLGGVSATSGHTAEDYAQANQFSRLLATTLSRRAPAAPFVYASSGATYGRNHSGPQLFGALQPISEYGKAKHAFDVWMHEDERVPARWFGLKYFNVYGPNEQHKGKTASMITQAAQQLRLHGAVQLFRTRQKITRDFVYVHDVTDVTRWFMEIGIRNRDPFVSNGLYNIGSGRSETFETVVAEVAKVLHVEPLVDYIEMPEELEAQYQYETQAHLGRLRNTGYHVPMTTLADGVQHMRTYLEGL